MTSAQRIKVNDPPSQPLALEGLLEKVAVAAPDIERLSEWSETQGQLHEETIALLEAIGVPRLFLPRDLGGWEVSPGICAQVCEAIADADPAAAWHVMVYNSARLMASTWPQETVEQLWLGQADTLVAASGHTPLQGTAMADGSYRVSGRNSFVSGVHHADYVLSPMICGGAMCSVLLRREQLHIEDDWGVVTGGQKLCRVAVSLSLHSLCVCIGVG